MNALEQLKEANGGTLPPYAWPGGYQIVYYFADGEACCADCANGENDSDATLDPNETGGWRLDFYGVHWEGPPEFCAQCNKELPSEYGDPEAPDN